MRKLFLLCGLAFALPAAAQQCALSFRFTSATSSVEFNNLTRGCTDWAITYNSTGFTVLTFTVQTAPNNAGVPGAWSTFAASSGGNPETSITQASALFTGYFPFVRVTLSGLTGSGVVTGLLYGSQNTSGSAAGSSIVFGPDANGAPPTENPVQVAGWDATNVRRILTDTSGRTQVVGAAASAAALAGNPVRVGISDATNARDWLSGSAMTDNNAATGAAAVSQMLWDGVTYDRAGGNTEGQFVQGSNANGASVAGTNPVWIGGNDGSPGNVIGVKLDPSGFIQPDGTSIGAGFADAFGNSNIVVPDFSNNGNSSTAGTMFRNVPYLFNGTTYDRVRGSSGAGLIIGGFSTGAAGTFYGLTACDSSALVNVTAGATTELVALTAARSVRVCSFAITADTAASTARFVYGTGANCGTGTTNITGAMSMGAASAISLGSGTGELFKTASANALCLTAVTGAINGVVTYAKF
jgi:hypothetical protein